MSTIPESIPFALKGETLMLTLDELGRRLAGQPPEVVDAIARVRAFQSLSDEEQYARIVAMYDELPVGEPGGTGEEEAYQASLEPAVRRLTGAQLRARRA
jgi:hypothetical protein